MIVYPAIMNKSLTLTERLIGMHRQISMDFDPILIKCAHNWGGSIRLIQGGSHSEAVSTLTGGILHVQIYLVKRKS